MTWYTQCIVQKAILPVLAKKADHVTMEEAKYHVVVLERSGASSRVLENHKEVMSHLKQWLPEEEGFSFDSFVPGPESGNSMWDTGTKVYKGCLLIGPHGGNMPNMMFLRPGCWVV